MFDKEFSPKALWKNLLTFRFEFVSPLEFLYQTLKLIIFTKNYFEGVRYYNKEVKEKGKIR